ncbi:hypothetical protein CDD83_10708 [Cordyceps sp. RAO-2017]|nr:hypothetical protein CDD83_10708 [Cordyceps sp. RAO-2017]
MDVITHIQGDEESGLTPLFLVHPISGVALPFLRLESLSEYDERPVYGITSPMHCPGGDKFKLPPSLKALAALYVEEVRAVQAEGPYLLGGWSMGGMVAMFMAKQLEAEGDEVLKVIMIDSANPEVFPSFSSAEEHREFAKATFDRTVSVGGLQHLEAGDDHPAAVAAPGYESEDDDDEHDDDDDDDDDDYGYPGSARERLSGVWRSASSSNTTVASSIFDQASPHMSDASLLSPGCSSDDESDFFFDDDCDCDSEALEAEEPSPLGDFVRQMRLHVHHGLELIAGVEPGELFAPGDALAPDAVLIKCTPERVRVSGRFADHEGVRLIEAVMGERAMRWDPARFRSFRSVPFSGDHDGAFQPRFVAELSAILRTCIEDLE